MLIKEKRKTCKFNSTIIYVSQNGCTIDTIPLLNTWCLAKTEHYNLHEERVHCRTYNTNFGIKYFIYSTHVLL